MRLKNTVENYGSVAKWLHWSTALLFLGSYVTYYYNHWFIEKGAPEGFTAIQLHFSIGVTVGVAVILRILWRLSNESPQLEPGSKLEHLAAHAGHFALYAIMIIMPLSGYMGTGGSTSYFFLFEIPKFEDTAIFEILVTNWLGMTFAEFEKPMDFIHKDILGAWLVWLLIAGHALAALYHQFVRKDRTVSKMTRG